MQYEVVTDRVVVAELDNESVLLDVSSGLYYGLDEVGSRIWTLLNEALDVETIVSRLADEYEAAPDELGATWSLSSTRSPPAGWSARRSRSEAREDRC